MPAKVRIVPPSVATKLLASPARVVPVDLTWYLPNLASNAKQEYDQVDRIKNAVFFDVDKVCYPNSKYPHMLPPHRLFDEEIGKLGINREDSVLVYDRQGVFSGPRVAWTFSLYGHKNVFLLDHYPEFRKAFQDELEQGLNTTSVQESVYDGIDGDHFSENFHHEVIEFDELFDLVENGGLVSDYALFDARSADRFHARVPEPRPNIPSGHVPGALSLPFTDVLDEAGHYKSPDELHSLFQEKFGLDLRNPDKKGFIVMCATGVTAVIVRLALERVNPELPIRVYDGSWTEWAQRAPDSVEK